jgi:uncharacterized protein (TIGR03663 family)
MDNRRMSARAESGASRTTGIGAGRRDGGGVTVTSALDRAFELTRLNWEVILFVGIMVAAFLTRVIDLGDRAFHHDESIHAYFSNYYLQTGNFTNPGTAANGGYDPTYHGPFLYSIVAFGFFLFGTNDAIARLMPALFGILLIGLIWLLRPFIGRTGALVGAFLVLISPSITYYSRSLRHDIFALTGLLLLFVSILWFIRTHQAKWVYLGALGFIVAYASHELTFIVAFIFALFLLIAAFAYNTFSGSGGARDDVNPVRSALSALRTQRWTLTGAVLIILGVYVVMYTNFLTRPDLVLSGIIEGFQYWFLQQKEARGNQPIFYYVMLMPIYEPLALLAGTGTVVYMLVKWIRGDGDTVTADDGADGFPANADVPVDDEYGHPLPVIGAVRGFAWSFLAFWAFGAFVAFSVAGEKMPWLNMQIALPFTLLAAAGIGKLLSGMEWKEVRKGGGLFLGVALVLFIFAAYSFASFLTGAMPKPTGAGSDFQNVLRGILLFVFTVGLLALGGWLSYKLLPGRAAKVIGFTITIFLALYGIRSMVELNYNHGDVPNEMMVYTQSAPDTTIVSDLLHRLSRDETSFDSDRNAQDVTGGHGLPIALDQNDATDWPFEWYLRDMKKLTYFNLQQWQDNNAAVAPNQAVIIASEATEKEANFKTFLGDKYSTNKYTLNWWFPEETYRDSTTTDPHAPGNFGKALSLMFGNSMKYLLYRDPGKPLGSRSFYLHIRNDLAVKVGLGSAGVITSTPDVTTPPPNSPVHAMTDLAQASAERGAFNLPRGIATGPDGSFYVVDTGNMRIQKFDSTGKFVALIGAGKGNGDGQFAPLNDQSVGTGPGGIAVDKQGNIYVADTWNHRIQKFTGDGTFLTAWGGFIDLGNADSANDSDKGTKFYGPRGVAIGPDGNVYVADTGNKRISIFKPDGTYVREISSGKSADKIKQGYAFNQNGEMNEPIGVAVDAQGNVYVADSVNHRIQKFDATGAYAAQWPIPSGGWDPGSYLEPFLALDAQGNLYATAPTSAQVYKFDPTGKLLGQKGTSPKNIILKTPTGITIGSDGNIYVSDTGLQGVVNMGTIP